MLFSRSRPLTLQWTSSVYCLSPQFSFFVANSAINNIKGVIINTRKSIADMFPSNAAVISPIIPINAIY